MLTGGIAGSAGSLEEDCPLQHLELESTVLRSTVYCRAPASLQTGQLQLQLVADSGGGGGGARSARAQQAQRFLFLGEDGGAGAGLADQERWIVEQPVIVLPDSGGLVLPLASNGFLVGLLVVERCSEEGEAAPTTAEAVGEELPGQAAAGAAAPAAAAGGAAATAADAAGSNGGGSRRGAMPQPSACLLFRSTELQLIKQTAAVLALACAMDLRAALERAGAAYRQRQASALVQEVRSELGLGRYPGVYFPGRRMLSPVRGHLYATLPAWPLGVCCTANLAAQHTRLLPALPLPLCGCDALPWSTLHECCTPATRSLSQQAKKPLSVMRTLGTMLLPRLQPGEPDRDFAQGVWTGRGSHRALRPLRLRAKFRGRCFVLQSLLHSCCTLY